MTDTDSALRHLRDALVLTEAAVDEVEGADWPIFANTVRARVHLTEAIKHLEESE